MRAYPFKIPKSLNESLSVQVDRADLFYDKLHQHEEIQISHIIAGKGKLLIADSVHYFSEDDIFIIGGNIPHVFQSNGGSSDSHMVSVFFSKMAFKDLISNIPETEQLKIFIEKTKTGISLKSKKRSVSRLLLKIPVVEGLQKFILFLKLIQKINDAKILQLSEFEYPKKLSNQEGKRMQVVFDFVMSNFQKDITLDAISKKVHMTPNSFCRFFKQRTSKTFFQFLIELRIAHACQMLVTNGDSSIAEICLASGFNSISHFNRTFKKLKGDTPSEFVAKTQLRQSIK